MIYIKKSNIFTIGLIWLRMNFLLKEEEIKDFNKDLHMVMTMGFAGKQVREWKKENEGKEQKGKERK